jgi:hypothetical protein
MEAQRGWCILCFWASDTPLRLKTWQADGRFHPRTALSCAHGCVCCNTRRCSTTLSYWVVMKYRSSTTCVQYVCGSQCCDITVFRRVSSDAVCCVLHVAIFSYILNTKSGIFSEVLATLLIQSLILGVVLQMILEVVCFIDCVIVLFEVLLWHIICL